MSNSKSKSEYSRAYYDQMYREGPERNPAFDIYDQLRVTTIHNMISKHEGNVLIVGCGSRRDLEIPSKTHSVYGFDLSIEAVRQQLFVSNRLLTADALAIPFPASRFDVIICSEVLEHVPNIQGAISEFHRVLKPGGMLVVSSPNWLSWFGVSRWIGEKLFRRSFHSSGQPYDEWKTYKRYQNDLKPFFEVVNSRGIWYLPPLHYRGKGLPTSLTSLIYRLFKPFEIFFSTFLPNFGHLIVLQCVPTVALIDKN